MPAPIPRTGAVQAGQTASHDSQHPQPSTARPELPPRLRRLLHRTLDQQPDARAAAGQACWCPLPSSRRRAALSPVRPARAARRLRLAAAEPRDVRRVARAGDGLSAATGTGNPTGLKTATALFQVKQTACLRLPPIGPEHPQSRCCRNEHESRRHHRRGRSCHPRPAAALHPARP